MLYLDLWARRCSSFIVIVISICSCKVCLEPFQLSMMEHFFLSRELFSLKSSIIYVWKGSKYTSAAGSSLPFFGNFVKRALIWEKMPVVYGLDFSFKMQLLRVSRRNRKFFYAGSLFCVLQMIVYGSPLIPTKLPCPKKILITRL